MKTILVTGSNGLLGQTLTEVITVSRRANLIASSKGLNRYPTQEGYKYVELDISNRDQLIKVISEVRPDVIINTAAITNVDVCHEQRDLCWELNVAAVKNLVDVCTEQNIHLVHLSTDFVFDGNSGPYSEEAPANPLSFYGKSKYEAEKIIQRSLFRWAIVRTCLVYGITSNMSRSNIVLWAKSALEKRENINVVDDQWRTPTLVNDLAEGCLLIAEQEATGIFHISGKDMMTIYDLVGRVADFWDLDKSFAKPVSSQTLNQEAKRPLKTGFVLNRASKVLGYNPHSFLEGLAAVKVKL